MGGVASNAAASGKENKAAALEPGGRRVDLSILKEFLVFMDFK